MVVAGPNGEEVAEEERKAGGGFSVVVVGPKREGRFPVVVVAGAGIAGKNPIDCLLEEPNENEGVVEAEVDPNEGADVVEADVDPNENVGVVEAEVVPKTNLGVLETEVDPNVKPVADANGAVFAGAVEFPNREPDVVEEVLGVEDV